MKKYLTLMLIIATTCTFYAQDIVNNQAILDSIYEPKLTGDAYFATPMLLGSQYFNFEWEESDIYLTNGEVIYNKLLKYNGYTNDLIWLTPETFKQVKLDKFGIDKFVFKNYKGNKVYFKRLNTKRILINDSTDIFLEVKTEGKVSLYIHHKIDIVRSVNKDNKGGIYTYNELEPTPVYYLKLPDNSFNALHRLNRHSLLRFFPDKKATIRKVLRQNHQAIETEDDLSRAVMLINKEVLK